MHEENVNFEAKLVVSRAVNNDEQRFIIDRVPTRLPGGTRTKRCTVDVQNSEGRIQGAGREENRASKSRCIMRRGNKHRWSPFVISIG